jgi:hypothetical protein
LRFGCVVQLSQRSLAAAQTWLIAHAWQVSPSLPQCWNVPPSRQVSLSQQPSGQNCGVQAQKPSALHGAPVGHALHCAPPVPHVSFVFGSQVPAFPGPSEQQSFGQLSAVQRQAVKSALQTVPGGQVFGHVPPHPSGPHRLPAQPRAQHVPCAWLQTQLRKFGQSLSWVQLPAHATGTQAPPTHSSWAPHWRHGEPLLPQAPSAFPS